MLLRFLLLTLLSTAVPLRVFVDLPDPSTHPFYARHTTKPPPLSLYAGNASTLSPGFAAVRGLNSYAPQTWKQLLDLYTNSVSEGGLGLANIIWPGYGILFSPYWIELATVLKSRGLPAVDLGGFVPGGMQDFDLATAVNYTAGLDIMGPLLVGTDMGEQDGGYAGRSTTLLAPSQRSLFHSAFAEFSHSIEQKCAGRLMALSSSVYAVHHWLKTGLYAGAGSETSQSNGNAQLLYAFVRGAAKQYGTTWFGQVSIFNSFGVKSYDSPSPSPNCTSQSSASPTCGTSLNLMKRLMYSQLAYNSAYFAFEGGLLFTANSSLTPIGLLQQETRAFFTAAAASGSLGTHTPTIAILLDYAAGWARPCDSRPQRYTAVTWGGLPWDAADALADAVFDELLPGYRAGALLRNESGVQAPTPYGDAADVLLSDALLEVLGRYDTVVLAHRLGSGAPGDVRARLEAFMAGGGRVLATAASVGDLGGLAGAGVASCSAAPSGTVFTLLDGSGQGGNVTEPLDFTLCTLALPPPPAAAVTVLATAAASGAPVAVRIAFGNGSLTLLAPGTYGMAPNSAANATAPPYACGVDQPDSREGQPYALTALTRHYLQLALASAALFDLGQQLSWVPQRLGQGEYLLTVTNPGLTQAPLAVAARAPLGAVTAVTALPLPHSEQAAVGYAPHGYEGVDRGATSASNLAGGDTVLLRVSLSSDGTLPASSASAGAAAAAAALSALPPQRSRLLRLASDSGSIQRALAARPGFEAAFSGVLVDWSYLWERTREALAREGAWLASLNCSVAVDFTAGLTLFPGLRLVDDMGGYYEQSMAAVQQVLGKMPLLGARHALLALHSTSEIPPANFSSDPTRQTAASVTATLQALAARSAALNVTLHLRRSARNDNLAGGGLGAQAAFAAAAGIKLAPALAYAAISGDSAAAAAQAFAGGTAQLLLLSSAWSAYPGHAAESALLAAVGGGQAAAAQCAWLRTVQAAATGVGGVVVLDAGYSSQEEEMADARLVDACVA